METTGFENNKGKTEKIEEMTQELAFHVALGNITTDNPSPSTSLDSLDQILLFELAEYIDDEYIPLSYLRTKTLLEIENIPEEKMEEITENRVIEDSYMPVSIDLENGELKKEIKNVALYNIVVDHNIKITVDNPSPTNEGNSLDQFVAFHFRDWIKGYKDFETILYAIKTRMKELETGSNLSDFYLDDNFITVTF